MLLVNAIDKSCFDDDSDEQVAPELSGTSLLRLTHKILPTEHTEIACGPPTKNLGSLLLPVMVGQVKG